MIFQVTFHNAQDYPAENNNAKLLGVQEETLVQLTGNLIKCSSSVLELDAEQRQCAYDEELKLDYFQFYSPVNCLTECRMKYILKVCDCLPFYYPIPPGLQISTIIITSRKCYVYVMILEVPVCNISKLQCLMDQVGKF